MCHPHVFPGGTLERGPLHSVPTAVIRLQQRFQQQLLHHKAIGNSDAAKRCRRRRRRRGRWVSLLEQLDSSCPSPRSRIVGVLWQHRHLSGVGVDVDGVAVVCSDPTHPRVTIHGWFGLCPFHLLPATHFSLPFSSVPGVIFHCRCS